MTEGRADVQKGVFVTLYTAACLTKVQQYISIGDVGFDYELDFGGWSAVDMPQMWPPTPTQTFLQKCFDFDHYLIEISVSGHVALIVFQRTTVIYCSCRLQLEFYLI